MATRVLTEMQRPFDVFGNLIQVGASIGVAMAGPDHTAPELLIRDADFAMYSAKQAGGGRYQIFDVHMEGHVSNQQERERELRSVVENRQLEVWFQPIYRLQTGKLDAFEALLRWRRSDGSIDSFRDLLPVAEDTGLSISLGVDTVETVCRQLRKWSVELPQSDLTLTVNLSHRQFYHPDMVAQVKMALAATGVDPTRLLFEIPESSLNENPDAAVAILQRMVDCNVRIAVDNFGSNLAPLNLLARLPIDVVKLDPRLTVAATSTGRQLAVLRSVIHLGHTLGMQVIAQGIETVAQLDAMCRLGCELGQGHYLSQAVDPARALHLAGAGYWVKAPTGSSV